MAGTYYAVSSDGTILAWAGTRAEADLHARTAGYTGYRVIPAHLLKK